MSKLKTKAEFKIIASYPRSVHIDEPIFQALDIYSLSLYMAFRYEADFSRDVGIFQRPASYMYAKAKISRAQFYRCLNVLESHGLIKRDNEETLGEATTYQVSRILGYFNSQEEGVSDRDRGVSDRDTYSILRRSINTSTSGNQDLREEKPEKPPLVSDDEIVSAYHEVLPDSPKIRKIDAELRRQFKKMQKEWPTHQAEGKEFTIESFKKFLMFIQATCPGILRPYVTAQGNRRQNNLRNLTRDINITKIINGEFSFQ